ncbi:hypothetical protein J31TS4_41330 [Paenibacillus sp. J31TS4]|uniref:cupredoxin domain-containing protein n=1 Tax=Paenibacillus sp. J31TS4 TaxID=2807195 RepID=UPI001B25BF89|nr:cupredoxin domain-containing protein [Paenibacillus sp. J31TS4]GIP40853.1 hypothetical protein J31TS4_41330 [Paenibacillus sp. J31TS4]
MKKSMTVLTLALSCSLALAGCGSKDSSGGSGSSSAPSSAPSAGTSMSPGTGGSASTDVKEVKVSAKNFTFSPNEIRVKEGQKVKLTLDNTEGMHGLAIPDFKVDLQKPGTVEFTADKKGEHEFHCSVMCGAGHADMKGKIIVE